MKCPHCLDSFHDTWAYQEVGEDVDCEWIIRTCKCPACSRLIIESIGKKREGYPPVYVTKAYIRVRPKSISRSPIPAEVPTTYAEDYREACLVLSDSPKASAALSRRCLQRLLREVVRVKPSDLYNEIQDVLDSRTLPTYLAESIDTIRQIGKYAAHPNKSTSTCEIIEVEPGEAEWSLDTLEGLFDFYFVQPVRMQAKKDALNKKLSDTTKAEKKT